MKPFLLLKECRQRKQSAAIAYVQGVRHGVYVRSSTNQSTAMAYVTGRTYAFRPIRARRSRILISAAPCGGFRNLAQPHAASNLGVENLLLYYCHL